VWFRCVKALLADVAAEQRALQGLVNTLCVKLHLRDEGMNTFIRQDSRADRQKDKHIQIYKLDNQGRPM